MTKTMLILFWAVWLLDLLALLLGYREFIGGAFGRSPVTSFRYVAMWIFLFVVMLLILGVSLYFKNSGQSSLAITVVVVPLVLALPYALFLGVTLLGGKNNWQ